MGFKAVVLDMDGTLLDSSEAHVEAWVKAAGLIDFILHRERVVRELGKTSLDMARRLLPAGRVAEAPKLAEVKDRVFLESCLNLVKPIKSVEDALRRLRSMGLKVAVASSNPRRIITQLLERFRLLRYVDVVVGSEDVERGKPHPDMILEALKRLNVKPWEAVYVGDTVYDIEAGKAADVFTIAVLTGVGSKDELEKAKPDAILKGLKHLPKILLTH